MLHAQAVPVNRIYLEALYRAAKRAKPVNPRRPKEGCKHWFIYVKHPCGPPTEVCQDCGHERAA